MLCAGAEVLSLCCIVKSGGREGVGLAEQLVPKGKKRERERERKKPSLNDQQTDLGFVVPTLFTSFLPRKYPLVCVFMLVRLFSNIFKELKIVNLKNFLKTPGTLALLFTSLAAHLLDRRRLEEDSGSQLELLICWRVDGQTWWRSGFHDAVRLVPTK